jgi:hypothetical protein
VHEVAAVLDEEYGCKERSCGRFHTEYDAGMGQVVATEVGERTNTYTDDVDSFLRTTEWSGPCVEFAGTPQDLFWLSIPVALQFEER